MDYDKIIKIENLIPPLGENKYVGKVDVYIIGKSSDGPIRHNITESWGKTHEEAYGKALEKYTKWLKEQVKSN